MPSKKKVDKALEWATAEVCRLLDLFGERRYSFAVAFDKKASEYARVETLRTRSHFNVFIGPLFVADTAAGRANTILHEVLHVFQAPFRHLVHFTLDHSSLPEGEREMFQALFRDEYELYTDRMASVLAGKL